MAKQLFYGKLPHEKRGSVYSLFECRFCRYKYIRFKNGPAWKQRDKHMNVSRMDNNGAQRLTDEYCTRFGQIAVEKGFITKEQLKQALSDQVDDDVANRRHRLIGTILFERDWITPQQIDIVLNAMSRNNRASSL